MFDLTELESLSVVSSNSDITVLDVDQASRVLLGESLQNMARNRAKFSDNETIAIRQEFDRDMSRAVLASKDTPTDTLVNLAKQAIMRVSAARQSDEPDAENDAIARVDAVCNFFASLASNIARNSYYRHRESLKAEGDVDKRMLKTKSTYDGWKMVAVEPDVLADGAEQSVEGVLSLIKATLPHASTWMRGFMSNEKTGDVQVQLGYRKVADDDVNQFYTLAETWADLEANQREVYAPIPAKELVAAFQL